jgi:RHS repeat-associated protein
VEGSGNPDPAPSARCTAATAAGPGEAQLGGPGLSRSSARRDTKITPSGPAATCQPGHNAALAPRHRPPSLGRPITLADSQGGQHDDTNELAGTIAHGYTPGADLPNSMVSTLGGYVPAVSYTAFYQVATQEIGSTSNNAYITSTYDPHTGALPDSQTENSAISTTPFDDTSYTYDPAGNITRQTDTRNGTSTETQCYAYDTLDRLTQAWTATDNCAADPSANGGSTVGDQITGRAYWTSWSFDPLGNRTDQTDHSVTGGQDTVTSYTYNGNSTSQPDTLTTASTTGPAGSAQLVLQLRPGRQHPHPRPARREPEPDLDPRREARFGRHSCRDHVLRLRRRREPATPERPRPDHPVHLRRADRPEHHHRRGHRHPVPAPARRRPGRPHRHRHRLQLRAHRPARQQPAQPRLRRPEPRLAAVPPYGAPRGTPPASWPDTNGFLGKPTDTNTSLTTLGARQYDPATGRFLSADPVLDATSPQTLNGYTYAAGNPATQADPTGLCVESWCPPPPLTGHHPARYGPGHGTPPGGGYIPPPSTGSGGGTQVAPTTKVRGRSRRPGPSSRLCQSRAPGAAARTG